MRRETTEAYLIRHGWYQHINNLWNHDEPGLRRVDGMRMFRREAVEKQRSKDRSEFIAGLLAEKTSHITAVAQDGV